MNTLFPHAHGFSLYEYLLIIEPTERAQKEIQAFKRYFIKNYPYRNAIVSKAHITLARFVQYGSFESRIIQRLQSLASHVAPFDIILDGFGTFGHTIFVDVVPSEPMAQLINMHRQELRPLLGSRGTFASKPHITIARKLTPDQNNVVWPMWRRTLYRSSFRAKNITLLRRPAGTHGYALVKRFSFLGLPSFSTQGRLFA
jgi:2''-5'' RNA ligase